MSDLKIKISALPAGIPEDSSVIPYVDLTTGETKKALKSELKGEQGEAATLDVGTTTTGTAGTEATVTNSGTVNDAIFDFIIPRGDTGADSTVPGPIGVGIDNITLISTVGLVKTYRITYTDATTFDYEVTDGLNGTDGVDGRGIVSIIRTSGDGSAGTTDTYTITYDKAPLTSTFDVYNGADGQEAYTDAEIKVKYENNANTNAFTDAEKAEIVTLREIQTDTNEPTGFIREFPATMGILELSPDGVIVYRIDENGAFTKNTSGNFADGTTFSTPATAQTTAIFPANATGGFDVYIEGIKINKTALETATYTPASGLQFAYYDENAVLQTSPVFSDDYFEDKPIVSIVYGNIGSGTKVVFADERHGITMDGATHRYLHFTEGTKYVSGLSIDGLAVGVGTYTQTSTGVAYDEDIIINALAQSASPFWYIDGTAWRGINDGNLLAYMGTTYAQANTETATPGTYQLEEIGNNNYMNVHFVLTNDAEFPIVKILGQTIYNSVSDAQNGIITEANTLVLDGLPTPEFLFIGSVIIDDAGTLRAQSDGGLYYDLREVKFVGGSSSPTSTSWGDVIGTLSNQTDLQAELDAKQDILVEGAFIDGDKTKLDGIEPGATTDQDLSALALKANVLELDNTTIFTPDADYEPATKKYADDLINTVSDIYATTNVTATRVFNANSTSINELADVVGTLIADLSAYFKLQLANNQLLNGLISYYKADVDGSFPDAHGINDGTINNATYDVNGKINGAYDFNGTDATIDLGNVMYADTNFSVGGWINFDDVNTSQRIMYSGTSPIGASGFNWGLKVNNGEVALSVSNGTDAPNAFSSGITTGTWYHIMGTFDGSNIRFYLNGTLADTEPLVGTNNIDVPLTIGDWDTLGGYFNGILDEIGYWDRVLTDADITELYNEGNGLSYSIFTT